MTPTVHGICAFAVKVYQPYFVEQVFLIRALYAVLLGGLLLRVELL